MTRSKTQIRTREKEKTTVREVVLNDLEERVLRMRHGIVVPEDAPLEFRGQHDPELHATLVAMERRALQHMTRPEDERRKQEIIDELQGV